MTEINSNFKYLDYTSDSVEFYPGNNNIFVCGTYEIEKGDTEYKERRKGKLYLFEIIEENEEIETNSNSKPKFKEIQSIEFNSGILDMKWNKNNILGVVMSKGELNLYEYDSIDKKLLFLKCSKDISLSNDILSLSLDWNLNGDKLISSFSDGNIGIFKTSNNSSNIENLYRWKAHDYEAWICSFNYHNETMVFSGGDDCKFKIWDTRLITESEIDKEDGSNMVSSNYQPTIVKKCDMGVTSIHCHPTIENIIAQGSYDECLRIWDLRSMKQPLHITDSLGGGIWRIKWHPFDSNKLVTACMGGGFHILQSTNENDFSDLQIINSYQGPHNSIAYGVDWSYYNNNDNNDNDSDKQHIGCCSFYDKCLSIWNP